MVVVRVVISAVECESSKAISVPYSTKQNEEYWLTFFTTAALVLLASNAASAAARYPYPEMLHTDL